MASVDLVTSIYSSHAVYLERVAAGFGLEVKPYLNSIESRVTRTLNKLPKRALTTEQRNNVLSEIDTINREELQGYTTEYKENNKELAEHENEFNKSTLTTLTESVAVATPTAAAVNSLAIGTPIKTGDKQYTTYNRYINTYWKKYADMINATAEAGFLTGGTNQEIAKVILEQLPADLKRAENAAKTMARTATNHYGNAATRAFVDTNDKVLSGYRFIATLDGDTSKQCRSLDQRVFPKSANNVPWPPLHPNCRSRMVYEIDGRYSYDSATAKRPSKFTVDGDLDPKQVSSKAIYYKELGKLDANSQNAVLGPTLGKAFRKMDNPELFAKQTIDSTYNPISIKDLKKKDNELARVLNEQAKTNRG